MRGTSHPLSSQLPCCALVVGGWRLWVTADVGVPINSTAPHWLGSTNLMTAADFMYQPYGLPTALFPVVPIPALSLCLGQVGGCPVVGGSHAMPRPARPQPPFQPSTRIQPENRGRPVQKMYSAFSKYGGYPINLTKNTDQTAVFMRCGPFLLLTPALRALCAPRDFLQTIPLRKIE